MLELKRFLQIIVFLMPFILLLASQYVNTSPIIYILIWEMFAIPIYFLICENKNTLALFLIMLSTAGIIIEIIKHKIKLDFFAIIFILLVHAFIILISSIAAVNYRQVWLNQLKLQERLRRLAIIDPLTHLINGKYFIVKLEEEISRAKRERKKFTVGVFKIININKLETGLKNGCLEWNLTRIAEILRRTIRNFDTVARIKDDVFAILLTNSEMEHALEIKERFEQRLQENVISGKWKFSGYSKDDNLYVLAGYAIFPDDNVDALGLLEVAELNLEQNEKDYRYKITQDWLRAEKYALIEQLSASIAHEIKNPLTSVRGFIQLLKDREQNYHDKEHLRIILDELDRINKLVHEFLSFSAQKNIYTKFSIDQLIDDIIFIMSTISYEKEISIMKRNNLNNNFITGQPEKLKQVFINLIRNAIEAIRYDGLVEIILYEQGKNILILVKDNGCGIDQHTMKNIFHPFFTSKEAGTGLGLSISSQIVKEHGGEIWVESEVGKGTTFKIRLPRN